MRVLAFDTATAVTSVAISGRTEIELHDYPDPGARPGHATELLPLVHRAITDSGTGWDQIDRIAVGIGPGTFTGLRIGIATAQALAAATGKPLVGVSTLTALALEARDQEPSRPLLALIDARRGEAFAAAWSAGGAPASAPPALQPSVLTPEALAGAAAALEPGAWAVGDGALKFRELLEAARVTVPPNDWRIHRVTAHAHCHLATLLEPELPGHVQPLYLRVPDAELNLRRS